MKLLAFFISFLFYISSYAQTKEYQNLLDSSLAEHRALIVCSKPITKIRLDKNAMWDYFYYYKANTDKVLDTIMLAQIIENSKLVDTAVWQEKELKSSIIVSHRDENISKKKVFEKLNLTDKYRIKTYKKQINNYNSTEIYNRNLYYFSRPVFDNSKKYAILQWDNAHSGLGGGGGIILYHLQNNTWKKLAAITEWKY